MKPRSSPSKISLTESSPAPNDVPSEPGGVGLHSWTGRFQIAIAAVLWSTSGFFVKSDWFESWPREVRGLEIAFWRASFAILLLLPFIRKWQWHRMLIPMAFCFAIMVWTFMTAMVHGPAANAIWLQYLCPAWVTIYAVFVQRQKPHREELRMVACCLAGVLLILSMELSQGLYFYATLLGILSGVCFAGVVITMRSLQHVDPAMLITVNHAATILLLAPVALQADFIQPSAYLALAFFGLVQMSIPYVLFARGLRCVTGAEASVLTLIEPILLPVWVYLMWGSDPGYEPTPWWTKVGGGCILLGLLARYLPSLWMEWKLRRNMQANSNSDGNVSNITDVKNVQLEQADEPK